jgi:hypothetical protein
MDFQELNTLVRFFVSWRERFEVKAFKVASFLLQKFLRKKRFCA